MTDDLDLLLSRPLDAPHDAAFAARVLGELGRMQARDDRIWAASWAVAACFVLALLPMTNAGAMVALSASQLATSIPFAIGIALLSLSWIYMDAGAAVRIGR
jgi:hypothetical protein